MFSLKNHARRGARVVAIGAVASAACASVAQAADLTWDPGHTPATPSGGSGTFDNSAANFSNGSSDVAPAMATNGLGLDDVHFAAPGGSVTVPAGTFSGYPLVLTGGARVRTLTIEATGYTFGTTGSKIFLNGAEVDNLNVLSLTAGDATFNADVVNINGDFVNTQNIHVAGGSTLTLHDFVNSTAANYNANPPIGGSYGSLRKTGAGALKFTGTLDDARAINQFFINEGSVELTGTSNVVSAGISVESGVTLLGNAKVTLTDFQKDYPSRADINLQTFTIKTGGHLSPGANTSTNFGGIGTFELETGGNNYITHHGTFQANSNLDLDIASSSSYDSFKLTCGAYSETRFTFEKGAKVNINAVNPLTPGVYNIITGAQNANNSGNLGQIFDQGLAIGTAPADFEYDFQDVLTINGIGARVTAVNLVISTPTTGSTWSAANTNWGSANWTGGSSPNATGTTATFAGAGGAVSVEAPKTVGRILLSGADYSFSGSALSLDNTGGNGANALIRANSNSHTFNNSVVATGTDLDIQVKPGAALNFAGGIDNSFGRVVTLADDGGALTVTGLNNGNVNSILHAKGDATVSNISGSGRIIVSNGILTLAGTNTQTGLIHLNGGELSIGSLADLGNSNINFRGGILRITGTALTSIPDTRIDNANPPVSSTAFGFSGGFDIADPNNTFTVNTSLGSFDGGALTKLGPGTLVLAGFNNYKGPTTIKQGILRFNGTSGGYSVFRLEGGTLGGSGSIPAPVIAGSAPHTIHPSAGLAAGSTNALNVSRLLTNSNTTLKFNLITPGDSSVNDRINVLANNRLVITGGSIAPGSTNTGIASLGFYKVISYVGSLTGSGSLITPLVVGNIDYYADSVQHPGFIDIHRGYLGDADDNGTVNFADFVKLSNNYGLTGKRWPGGDFNHDNVTNFADFVILSNHYGQTIGGGSFTASPEELAAMNAWAASAGPVPEPATLAVVGLGVTCLLARRRRT